MRITQATSTLNWRYAIGEIFLIAVGVLIALALDSWNTERQNQLLSEEYLNRLIRDIQADIAWTDSTLISLENKSRGLGILANASTDRSALMVDPPGLYKVLADTLRLAFNAPSIRRSTFDDMMGTGRLSLIASIDLRDSILEYYSLGTNSESRLEGRMTGYPQHVFENVPPEVLSAYDITPDSFSKSETNTTSRPSEFPPEVVESILTWASDPETQRLINAERNYSSHAIQIVEAGRNRAQSLISKIESAKR